MSHFILGSTSHKRFSPVSHQFKYPLYMIDIDISKLDSLNSKGIFFGYNQTGLFSLFDSDYLNRKPLTISEKIQKILEGLEKKYPLYSIRLITIPRFLFKTFKPVNFYLCYSKSNKLRCLIAEVTNTYHETSYYLMDQPEHSKSGLRFSIDKNFHVSPFFEEDGEYTFDVSDHSERFSLQISYFVNNRKCFYADFCGKKKALTSWQAINVLLKYPITSLMIFPRILYQAAKLHYIKKLPARSKPSPSQHNLLRPMSLSRLQKKIIKRIEDACRDLNSGTLTMTLPDSTTLSFGKSKKEPQAKITITNNWFFKSIKSSGEIGLGESYSRGEWDSIHLEKVIEFMIANKSQIQEKFQGSFLINILNKIKHRLRKNTLLKSRQNISEHYDLGNTFYKLFLDTTMMYSSGLFLHETDSLKEAQIQKVERLIDHLQVDEESHVLEIGSGWGYAAIRIAEKYGSTVTTITLSKEQKAHAEALVNKKGLNHLIKVELKDYRSMRGQFDAILSIEMIEAVGHDYLPVFFQACNALLKNNGRLALQTITYPNENYDIYRKGSDFIRKHIFPGGHLPSLGIMETITTTQTNLKKVDSVNIAQSYAKTLAAWREQFSAKEEMLHELGFDNYFYRKWIYYFAYCEAAFKTNYLGCYQLIYKKESANNA